MDKSFYQKVNTEEYTNEIEALINNKRQRIVEFVNDWLKFDMPPFDFIKAICNTTPEYSYQFTHELVIEIIKQEKVELIAPLLTFQINSVTEFIHKAMQHHKLNILDYIINEDAFFISDNKKNEIYLSLWSEQDTHFVYQAEKLLSDNHLTPSKNIFKSTHYVERVISSIITSNQFEYVSFIEAKMSFKFEDKNLSNYDSAWENNLKNKSFYYINPKIQSDFLNLFMKMDKGRDPLKILRKYFILKNHNKAKPVDNEVFLEVFDNLIQMKALELEECQKYLDVCDYKNFFTDYEAYSERKKLNQNIEEVAKSSDKKLKI